MSRLRWCNYSNIESNKMMYFMHDLANFLLLVFVPPSQFDFHSASFAAHFYRSHCLFVRCWLKFWLPKNSSEAHTYSLCASLIILKWRDALNRETERRNKNAFDSQLQHIFRCFCFNFLSFKLKRIRKWDRKREGKSIHKHSIVLSVDSFYVQATATHEQK